MISEERLREAAQEAARALAESLPEREDCLDLVPPDFEERRKGRLPKPAHSPQWSMLKRVACFFVALCLGSTMLLGTNAKAQELFLGWIREQVEDAQRYFHQGEGTPSSEVVCYQIEIPEGYWLEDSMEVAGLFSYTYVNETQEYIDFSYYYETENSVTELYLDDREAEKKEIMIHGNRADLYLSYDENANNTIIWMDQKTGALIDVTAFMDEEALIKLAESVVPLEN